MNTVVKSFDELDRDELYEILRLRASVFVVEQKCPYQDLDGLDKDSLHVWVCDDEGIKAYLRIYADGDAVHIGRVLAVERRRGLGSFVLEEGIRVAKERLCAKSISVEAQTYAEGLYTKHGFVIVSDEFLLDGIPHVRMELLLK